MPELVEAREGKYVIAKFPGQQVEWAAKDVNFSDTWVTITLTDGAEIHIYAQSLEYLEIT